jgi:uncharacterized protein (TIGR00255 family)
MALSGMTGFARVDGADGAWTWAVEVRSVNGRNLETRFRGPPGFDGLERVAREASQARFARGQINVAVQAKRADAGQGVRVNTEILARYVELSSSLMAEGHAVMPSSADLLALRGVIEAADEDETPEARSLIEAAMAQSLTTAFDALLIARRAEGAALRPVLDAAMARIADLVGQAEGEAAAQTLAIRDRFARRMTELAGSGPDVAERIVTEAAAQAVKADVREELDRLKTHIVSARELLASDSGAGRRLDFLSQEFHRETNTLCAKSATSALTAIGLDLKAVIEQFREQIQNVE